MTVSEVTGAASRTVSAEAMCPYRLVLEHVSADAAWEIPKATPALTLWRAMLTRRLRLQRLAWKAFAQGSAQKLAPFAAAFIGRWPAKAFNNWRKRSLAAEPVGGQRDHLPRASLSYLGSVSFTALPIHHAFQG